MYNILERLNVRLIIYGMSVLVVGVLLYLTDRPPEHTYFVYRTLTGLSLYKVFPNIFGTIGYSLPSFLHVFSFILLTAAFISCGKKAYLIISLSWFFISSAFELGQKFNKSMSMMVPDYFKEILFLENTKNYFIRGTFDYLDMFAIGVGTVAAYFVLSVFMRSKQ